MLHKCANPDCVRPFRRLSEGKLFLIEIAGSPSRTSDRWDGQTLHRVEHFWLCEQCASELTLSFDKGRGLVTVPLPEAVRKRPVSVQNRAAVGDMPHPMESTMLKRA